LLVRTGYGAELERTNPEKLRPGTVVDGMSAAADWILKSDFTPGVTAGSP
jgi:hypothetical protein